MTTRSWLSRLGFLTLVMVLPVLGFAVGGCSTPSPSPALINTPASQILMSKYDGGWPVGVIKLQNLSLNYPPNASPPTEFTVEIDPGVLTVRNAIKNNFHKVTLANALFQFPEIADAIVLQSAPADPLSRSAFDATLVSGQGLKSWIVDALRQALPKAKIDDTTTSDNRVQSAAMDIVVKQLNYTSQVEINGVAHPELASNGLYAGPAGNVWHVTGLLQLRVQKNGVLMKTLSLPFSHSETAGNRPPTSEQSAVVIALAMQESLQKCLIETQAALR